MKPFAGMSQELDAAIQANDRATAVVEADPIAMPKAIASPGPVAESHSSPTDTPVQSEAPDEIQGAKAPAKPDGAPAPAPAADSEQEAAEVMTAAIVGIHNRIGKGPWKITTDPESMPKLQTFDDKLIAIARQCKPDEPVKITFRTEAKGQYSNRIILTIDP